MPAFKLVQSKELTEFAHALSQYGWREQDFTLEEQVLDPATAEVESKTGDVIVTCARTHETAAYPVGRGSSWLADFVDDMRAGKFGRP